jgi:hypothetical protein
MREDMRLLFSPRTIDFTCYLSYKRPSNTCINYYFFSEMCREKNLNISTDAESDSDVCSSVRYESLFLTRPEVKDNFW